MRNRLAAELEIFQVHHDGIGDGVCADGVGDGVGKNVREIVGLEGVLVDAVCDPAVIENGMGDGVCVHVVDGVKDGIRYISFVRGARASASHGFSKEWDE